MQRRRFLVSGAVAGSAVLAGCFGGSDGNDTTAPAGGGATGTRTARRSVEAHLDSAHASLGAAARRLVTLEDETASFVSFDAFREHVAEARESLEEAAGLMAADVAKRRHRGLTPLVKGFGLVLVGIEEFVDGRLQLKFVRRAMNDDSYGRADGAAVRATTALGAAKSKFSQARQRLEKADADAIAPFEGVTLADAVDAVTGFRNASRTLVEVADARRRIANGLGTVAEAKSDYAGDEFEAAKSKFSSAKSSFSGVETALDGIPTVHPAFESRLPPLRCRGNGFADATAHFVTACERMLAGKQDAAADAWSKGEAGFERTRKDCDGG